MSRIMTILGIAVTLAMVASLVVGVARVGAQTATPPGGYQNYSVVSYGPPNIYNEWMDCGFEYSLVGLDASHRYQFYLSTADMNGRPVHRLATTSARAAVTSDRIVFGPDPQDPLCFGQSAWWPETTFGPLVVTDEWGRVLGRHFQAGAYGLSWGGDFAVSGYYRTGIGSLIHQAPVNSDGYFHDENAIWRVTTTLGGSGNWTLLHFVSLAVGRDPDEYIELTNVETGDAVATFATADLEDYYGKNSGYVVLTTNGACPAWVDCARGDIAFTTLDNPLTLTAPAGVYEYARLDGDHIVLGEGESLWVVSDHPSTLDQAGEWGIVIETDHVISGKSMILYIKARTSEIWAAMPTQMLTDSQLGLVDDTEYAFAQSRRLHYTTDTTPVYLAGITYRREAAALHYGQDAALFGFEDVAPYTFSNYFVGWATTEPTPKPHTMIVESVTNIPSDMGWGDGVLTLIYIALCVGAWVLIAVFLHSSEPFSYIAVYEVITIGLLLAGWWDVWAKIVIGVLAVAIFLAWMLGLGRGQESSAT